MTASTERRKAVPVCTAPARLTAEKRGEYVRGVVEAAPPMAEEQLLRIAGIVRASRKGVSHASQK